MSSPATYASSGFYLYLSSVDSVDYFPSNTLDNFIVKLPELYKLPGHWEVALTEIHLPAREGRNEALLVLTGLKQRSNRANMPQRRLY